MSHSTNHMWVHVVWSTRFRSSVIRPEIEKQLHYFIHRQIQEMGCFTKAINGMPDHIHCLFQLRNTRTLAYAVKQIKGASSRFVNERGFVSGGFKWQEGYSAYSVSPSALPKSCRYIENQKEHHLGISYEKELIALERL